VNRNRKTNPEQTLSVPVVFRNCLKFSEFVKASEIIRRRQRAAIDHPAAKVSIEIILVNGLWPTLLSFLASALDRHPHGGLYGPIDPFRAERNEIKTPTIAGYPGIERVQASGIAPPRICA
jgi:hypothetical protein